MGHSDAELPGAAPVTEGPERGRRRRDLTRLVVGLVLVAALVAFVLDNSQAVSVSFVFTTTTVPLIWVLLATAALGAVADRVAMVVRSRQRAKRAHALATGANGPGRTRTGRRRS
ncbi:MAG: lipopolysaccharide assembly protein LapA domain-containing protein [Acidimicrobiales bacterium]